MAFRSTLTTVRDWAALIGAVAMVVFLTFGPRNGLRTAEPEAARHAVAATDRPSRSAALLEPGEAIR